MSLAALLNRPLTIIQRSDAGAEDEYGNPVPTEAAVEVVGELQQIRRDEPGDQGEMSRTDWLLILPAGTSIDTGDAVICDGFIYEVVGDAERLRNPRTQEFSHVECTLRRTGSEGGS